MAQLDIYSVRKARKCITEKDSFSLTVRNLLVFLAYEAGDLKSINIENLTWFDIQKDFSEWKEHYDVNETVFGSVKEFLTKKITDYQE
jgi:hypothetical protein